MATLQTHKLPDVLEMPAAHKAEDYKDKQTEHTNNDTRSETSTIEHDHEPFETYQDKVRKLAAKHFKNSTIEIKRIKGGTYNRIVGLRVSPKPLRFTLEWLKSCFQAFRGDRKRPKVDEYIIRNPRDPLVSKIKRDVAILHKIARRVSLETPEIVAYDLGRDNLLNQPYTIQKRLPGRNLSYAWSSLTMAQKCSVVVQITKRTKIIAETEGPPGMIAHSAKDLTRDAGCTVRVQKLLCGVFDENPVENTAQSAAEHLLEQSERWHKFMSQDTCAYHEIWDAFALIVNAREKRGFLGGPCVLAHGDLREYNLLNDIKEGSAPILRVVDWDTAAIVPEVIAYRAPFWVWEPHNLTFSSQDEERIALYEPTTEEQRILKQVLVDTASEKFRRYALTQEGVLARRMMFILREGLGLSGYVEEAQDIVREWSELHPEDGVEGLVNDEEEEDEVVNDE